MTEFNFNNTLDGVSFLDLNGPIVEETNTKQNISVDDSIFLNESWSLSKDYNQRNFNTLHHTEEASLSTSATTYPSQNNQVNNLSLDAWGLPDVILQKYKERGVTNMFEWQSECLSNPQLLEFHTNLVYSAPTSAGKTLVAEILSIKTVVERRKKVLFILPFISVVREKMLYFQDILGGIGVRVEGYMGSHNPPGGFQTVQVAICTIEKANGIINRLLEDGTLDSIGTVVIDEMHLLGDPSRGYLLELMLTKLKFMSLKYENVKIQIIGMSATLPNLDLLGKWLNAELYQTNYRPIPLYEQYLIGKEIYNKDMQLDRTLSVLPELETDTDNILQLCLETVDASCSVLIFCPTKNWCESLAQQISQAFWKLGCTDSKFGQMLRHQLNSELINETLEQLKRCPAGLDKILHKTISFGVAFHHAGLTMDERDIIEGGFRKNIVRVLIATSTLSSGVNLPARRVIIRTPMFHGKPLDSLVYRQMIGRAGRMGRDTAGESILICQKNDYVAAKGLLSNQLDAIESCLEGAGKLKRAILEVVASGVAVTPDDVALFAGCTLLAVGDEQNALVNPIDEALDFLCRNEFIRLQKLEDSTLQYVATPLGKACLSSSMPPEEGLALFSEIEKARECFVLETELHIIYLVTPYNICNQWGNLDWMFFLQLWEKLPPSMKRVGKLVGVNESYIINSTRNKIQTNSAKLYQKQLIHRRFYTALALQDLVNEVPLNDVAVKFGCARGMLQSLQQSASTFAGMLTIFCRQLKWSTIEILVSQFQDRLQFGINRDLLDLMRLPVLNSQRARALYNSGIETLPQLASSNYTIIENILHKVIPFESEKERDGETVSNALKRNKIKGFWVTGREGLTEAEAAAMLVEEARKYLQLELGVSEVKWSNEIKLSEHQAPASPSVIASDRSLFEDSLELSANPKSRSNNSGCQCEPASTSLVESDRSLFDNSLEVPSHIFKRHSDSEQATTTSVKSEQSLFGDSLVLHEHLINNDSEQELATTSLVKSNQGLFEDSLAVHEHPLKRTSNNDSECPATTLLVESDQSLFGDSLELPSYLLKSKNNNDSVLGFESISDLGESFDVPNNSNELIGASQVEVSSLVDSFNPGKTKKSRHCLSFETPTKRVKMGTVDWSKIEMVDVCANTQLFETFSLEAGTQSCLSISFSCVKHTENTPVIGNNILKKAHMAQPFCHKTRQVVGVAISWGTTVVYYLSFEKGVVENSLKIELVQKLFNNRQLSLRLFDSKEQLKTGKLCCNVDFHGSIEDSKVADWLLDPEGKEKNLQAMALKYAPDTIAISQCTGKCKGVGSVGLDRYSDVDHRIRASAEAIVSWYACEALVNILFQEGLLQTYRTEMQTVLILTEMEVNGLGVNHTTLQALSSQLRELPKLLEGHCYSLVGYRFSLTSSNDVGRALGIYKGRKIATNKKVLEQIDTPLASLIVQWRKVNTTLTKMINPLITAVENKRIHGRSILHSATGRISMHEPNLQNIPRNFYVEVNDKKVDVACRDVFVPSFKKLFLSADYCQLELRLLAHFCQDEVLCSVMRSDKDVFKLVAAKWNNIPEVQVDDTLRQRAKQLCYGIIYGIGAKTLAEQLEVSEDEAVEFTNSFHNCYPKIKTFIRNTITSCRRLGYVETLASRKRFLPHINDSSQISQSQAERQAVNTTIQGSAADIAKNAMVLIHARFLDKFKHPENIPKLVLHLHDELLYEVPEKYLVKTATILKTTMEGAVTLSIPFPVKVKSGESWGKMVELDI